MNTKQKLSFKYNRMKKIYKIVCLLAVVISGLFFYKHYMLGNVGFISYGFTAITIASAALVHMVKCIRLYFVLYGAGIPFRNHARLYCMTVPVSMVLPFKLGDVFRVYCYSYQLDDYLKGLIAIILDRFVDTLALVSMVFAIHTVGNSAFPMIFYILLSFLFVVIIFYMLFPGICKYWKEYLLKCKATYRKNAVLKLLVQCSSTYQEIHNIMAGKFLVLYVLSFLAWMVEIGRLVALNSILPYKKTEKLIAGYLLSALNESGSYYLKQFICTSTVLLLVVYLVLKIYEIRIKSRGK